MGDVLSGIFGGGSRTEQSTKPDPISQQMNAMRLAQLRNLFSNSGFGDFARSRTGDAYAPSQEVSDLYGTATLSDVSPFVNTLTDTSSGLWEAANASLIDNASNLERFGPQPNNLMTLQDYIQAGLDAGNSYMSQIATPQIMSTMALQGLENGGAPLEALARASAEVAMPFVQSLPAAGAAFEATRLASPIARAQQIAQMYSTYGNLAGNAGQLGLAGLTGSTGRDVGLAQRASGLFNFADYSRQLQEQDLLRRQGVVTTGLTGLPFTPGSSTEGRKSSQPLFNWFGQG